MVCLKLMFLIVFAFRSFCVLTMQVSLRHKASAKSSVAAAMLLKCCPNRDAPTRGCLTQSSPTVGAANGRIFCRAWNAVLPDSKTSAKSSWANMIYWNNLQQSSLKCVFFSVPQWCNIFTYIYHMCVASGLWLSFKMITSRPMRFQWIMNGFVFDWRLHVFLWKHLRHLPNIPIHVSSSMNGCWRNHLYHGVETPTGHHPDPPEWWSNSLSCHALSRGVFVFGRIQCGDKNAMAPNILLGNRKSINQRKHIDCSTTLKTATLMWFKVFDIYHESKWFTGSSWFFNVFHC